MINKRYWQSGQLGLIVLLILVVMTTVGVSVATRSVSELRLSRQEQESTKVLNAAEAGIEEALTQNLATLVTNCPVGTGCDVNVDGVIVNYTVEQADSIEDERLAPGHTMEVNLGGVSNVTITWPRVTSDGCPDDAALVMAFVKSDGVSRYAKDPCNSRANLNGFDHVSGSSNVVTISGIGDYDLVRIKALYNETLVSVNGVGLPVQRYIVSSNATLEDGTTRAVQVTQRVGSLPSIFDYALFSGSTITK